MCRIMVGKEFLRKVYSEKRKMLSEKKIRQYSYRIASLFTARFLSPGVKKIHVYLPIKKNAEVDTLFVIQKCFQRKVQVFVPKIVGRDMVSVEIFEHSKTIENSWGIPEPENTDFYKNTDFDIIVVPLLYCDYNGNRVGYGKGFYDRFFSSLFGSGLKVGLNFFSPEERVEDMCPTDVPLDYLITPTEVLSFSGDK
ncbi:MAG: 5-formyltetrahydrofolate cyclo-ligase [Bergeyella sp.]|nr:5-formyltetrahydrofolate cyclo-ligase [Bergeyella sp.]